MIGQMQAVTGRKPKRRYTDIINARLPYLPALYAARDERKYREEMTELERARMAEEKRRGEKALSLQEKQAKKANLLGIANLGLSAGLGHAKNKALKDILTADTGKEGMGAVAVPPSDGILEGFTGALKTPGTYGTGLIGGLAGSVLGGKSKGKSALIGAGAGALASILGGGKSIYEHIVSGILGGIGGGLF